MDRIPGSVVRSGLLSVMKIKHNKMRNITALAKGGDGSSADKRILPVACSALIFTLWTKTVASSILGAGYAAFFFLLEDS